MGAIKPLIILFLLIIYDQNILCKDVGDEIKPANDLLNKPYPLATRNRDLRGVLDQLNNAAEQIKKRALASWNYLKKIATSARNEILKWVNSARQYAIKLEKSLEAQVRALQYGFRDIVTVILGTGEKVQLCILARAKVIEDTITRIGYAAVQCAYDKISNLIPTVKEDNNVLNDTLFIADLDRKLGACKADKANYEECLNTVNELVYDDIKEKHNDIIEKSVTESRDLASDFIELIVRCIGEYFVETVIFLVTEVREVGSCVVKIDGIDTIDGIDGIDGWISGG